MKDAVWGTVHEMMQIAAVLWLATTSTPQTPPPRSHTSSPRSQRPAPHHHRAMKVGTDGVLRPLWRLAVHDLPGYHCRRGALGFLGGECVWKAESRSEMQLWIQSHLCSRCHLQRANDPNTAVRDEATHQAQLYLSNCVCLSFQGCPESSYPTCS